MAKFPQVASLLLFSSFQIAKALFKPYQISYDDLLVGHVSSFGLVNALTTDGMVAISDLEIDERMLRSQHPCLLQEARQVIKAPDGTVRYTLATQTTGAGGVEALSFKNEDPTGSVPNACHDFNESSLGLRANVQATVQAFAAVLDLALGLPQQVEHDDQATSFTAIVEQGTHLEHFHSYVKMTRMRAASQEQEQVADVDEPPTLDWHVDQGVFLAFMPGRYETSGKITQGFYIRNDQGAVEEVDFAGASLVLMLGDGVQRYVNTNLKLRSVHHALRVPNMESAGGQARIWFGLMVLPPAGTLITTQSGSNQKTTFGDIRKGLVEMQPGAFALGCSQGVATAVSGSSTALTARHRGLAENSTSANHTSHNETGSNPSISGTLEEINCPEEEKVYCWHRCMNLTDYGLTHDMCEEQGQSVSCINPRGQLSDGDSHGDFYLECAAADTPLVTPFPTLPDYPRDEGVCDDFAAFVSSETYNHSMKLGDADGSGDAVLQWSVVTSTVGGVEKKFVRGRLAFNGIFGYLSIGKSGNVERNKMYNAPVIFALGGSNYTPQKGFEVDTDPHISEYVISGNTTSYRFWTDKNWTADSMYNTTNDECYTALLFTTAAIAGESLNLDGTDEMIWAANSVDTFAQYHGNTTRGVFNITWDPTNKGSSSGAAAAATVASLVGSLALILIVIMATVI